MPTPKGPQFKTWFHASRFPKEEFTAAPTIHVGDIGAAVSRESYMRGFISERNAPWSIHAVKPSEHMEFHGELLGDDEANAAEARYLEKSNYPIPQSVQESMRPIEDYGSARSIVRAARALAANKAVQYENPVEGGISAIIPSPHFNVSTHRMRPNEIDRETVKVTDTSALEGMEDPHQQTVLPMDYSGMKQSKRTKEYRSEKLGNL